MIILDDSGSHLVLLDEKNRCHGNRKTRSSESSWLLTVYICINIRTVYIYICICKYAKFLCIWCRNYCMYWVAWASLSVIIVTTRIITILCRWCFLPSTFLTLHPIFMDTTQRKECTMIKKMCPKNHPKISPLSIYSIRMLVLSPQTTKTPQKKKKTQNHPSPFSNTPPTRPPMGFYRGAEDVKCHQLVKSNQKNHTVASETEDLAFFTMVGMVGLFGGFPSLVSWFFL